mmetsp:Transcript_84727/g.168263  ORF Transcript_84727/g.168263 Transcript_84727/m.168263 type:complete len:254 (+) Transcript_84727:212-973(+)
MPRASSLAAFNDGPSRPEMVTSSACPTEASRASFIASGISFASLLMSTLTLYFSSNCRSARDMLVLSLLVSTGSATRRDPHVAMRASSCLVACCTAPPVPTSISALLAASPVSSPSRTSNQCEARRTVGSSSSTIFNTLFFNACHCCPTTKPVRAGAISVMRASARLARATKARTAAAAEVVFSVDPVSFTSLSSSALLMLAFTLKACSSFLISLPPFPIIRPANSLGIGTDSSTFLRALAEAMSSLTRFAAS